MKPMCLLQGGSEYLIEVAGQPIRFEMHPHCGPMPHTEIDIGPKHEFWRIVSLWAKQGGRVENGVAIWEEPQEKTAVFTIREIKQCDVCGEQMSRESAKEPWTCWPCEIMARQQKRR